jgi:beta-lactamase class A
MIIIVVCIVSAIVLAVLVYMGIKLFGKSKDKPSDKTQTLEEANSYETVEVPVSENDAADGEGLTLNADMTLPEETVSDTVEAVVDDESTERIELDDTELLSGSVNLQYGVYYFNTGEYCDSGNSGKAPSASVIKVFIMEYAFVKASEGSITLDTSVGGKTILSLVTSMIQQSDNNATNALIEYFGMPALNEYFEDQGYFDTVLERKMLDDAARAGGKDNYTSLKDCINFLKQIYNKRDVEPFSSMLNIMKGQQVRTKIPSKLPAGLEIANKTGELSDVENDIGIVFAENSPFAIVVLSSGVTNSTYMRAAIGDFALYAYQYQLGGN